MGDRCFLPRGDDRGKSCAAGKCCSARLSSWLETITQLTRHDEFIDSLVEVEHDWKRSQSNTCVNEDTDDFWLHHYLELKRLVNEQRGYEEDSLDELRDEALAKAESETYFADDFDI